MSTFCRRMWMAAVYVSTKPISRPMVVRVLLSINRTGSLAEAEATVAMAAKLRREDEKAGRGPSYIVGIDFSGNPTKGSFGDFLPAFEAARAAGLQIAVHVGEIVHAHACIRMLLCT